MQTTIRSFASFCLVLFGLFGALAATKNAPPTYIDRDIVVQTANGPVTLRAGTPVLVEAAQNYSAKNLSAGQTITVRAKFNVVVAKQTLISAGALGTAMVTAIEKPKMFGKAGSAEFLVQSIMAIDGQQIPLTGIPLTVEGPNKKGLAIGLAIGLGLLTYGIGAVSGFFIKGKPAELRAGMTISSSTASDVEVEPDSKQP